MAQLEIGSKAPEFTLPRDGGSTISSAELKGKKYVIYFYPKDDTPGCTTEAKDFTCQGEAFKAAGVTIIGVSKDSVAKHDKFKTKYDLGVILGSDEEGNVIEAFGAWKEKSMYGKTFMGIERSTFLIDEAGNVEKIWRKVKVKGHVDEVLVAASE